MQLEQIVLGTAGLGGVWGKVDGNESIGTILHALQAGICAIDTSPSYGEAESYVGAALQQWDGNMPRISTKVGRSKGFGVSEGYYDFSEASMQRSVIQSLQTLGLQKLDILFLHDPKHMEASIAEKVVKTMRFFKEAGYASKIGLGGNPPPFFDGFIKEGVFDVLMEFNKLNACNIAAIDEYLPFCNKQQIRYYAASPLHMGLLGEAYNEFTTNPPDWIDKVTLEKAVFVNGLANLHGLPLASLAHRFLLSLPYEFDIIIGASNKNQLEQTLLALKQGVLPASLQNNILENINRKLN